MAKVDLFPDFREFLESLNSNGVRYLLLGGYAVIHYGYRRATDDLDVWIAPDPENAQRLSRVLQEFGGAVDRPRRPEAKQACERAPQGSGGLAESSSGLAVHSFAGKKVAAASPPKVVGLPWRNHRMARLLALPDR
jgi:hypothetical protein